METLKIHKINNTLGIVLPKSVLSKLNVGEGDSIYLSEAPDGFRLTALAPTFAKEMEAAEEIMREAPGPVGRVGVALITLYRIADVFVLSSRLMPDSLIQRPALSLRRLANIASTSSSLRPLPACMHARPASTLARR